MDPVAAKPMPAGILALPSRDRLTTLDLARGGAALLVCLQHLRNATLVDYAAIDRRNSFDAALYFVTNLGHESVMIFFVLSGFFVGGSVLRAARRFDWNDYLLARGLRLWCVLLPCLVITWLADRWLVVHAPGILSGDAIPDWHSLPTSGSYDSSWSTGLGNLLFLQTIFVPVYGINGPLWSLANEAWYYVLFPLVWVAVRPGSQARRLVCAFLAAAVFLTMPVAMRWLFLVWLFGVGVYFLDARGTAWPRWAAVPVAIGFVAALGASRLRLFPTAYEPLPDLLLGVTFAAFCLVLVRADAGLRMPRLARRVAFWLSDISFSLYLSHFPLIIVLAVGRYEAQRMQPDAPGLAMFIGWLALLLAAGHAMWWMFESRTPALRRVIREQFRRRQRANG